MLLALVFMTTASAARAQVEEPLYAREPADAALLDAANDSRELEIVPDSTRTFPSPLPSSGSLKVRLMDRPSVEMAIEFGSIKRLETFPQRLLRSAKELASQGEFGEAYEHFARLARDYPNEPGFAAAFAISLREEAKQRLRAGEQDHALALLETLAERAPRLRGLRKDVESIGDEIIGERYARGDYAGVRRAIDALESQFKNLTLTVRDRWTERIEQAGEKERKRAEALLAQGKPRLALRAISGALSLDPDSPATNRLAQRLSTNDKTLWVAVWETAATDSAGPDLHTPAATRQSRLVGGRLATLEAHDDAGGRYASPLGRLRISDDRRRLTIPVGQASRPSNAYRVSRALLRASPTAAQPIGLLRALSDSIAVDDRGRMVVSLKRPHPAPAALAALPLPAEVASFAPSSWRRVAIPEGSEADARYERTGGQGAFDAVEEYRYETFDDAVDALRAREVHLLANVPPWQLSAFNAMPGVRLRPYRLPTLHCLLIGPNSSLRGRREIRRAITYSIAREETLSTLVMGGQKRPGFDVLSAPMPRGVSVNDPLRYGYNIRVEPRPYEPRLGALLLAAARAADQAARNAAQDAGEPLPSEPPIPASVTLAHTPTPTARLAAAAIRDQIESIGLGVTLVEADEASLADGSVGYDLRYVEITIGEPLADAWRLLGPGGISGDSSPAMRAGLQRVLDAASGKAAKAALLDLHRILFAELPMIPLWQTVEHFAYQRSLRGIEEKPIDLYQGIDAWRVSGGGAR